MERKLITPWNGPVCDFCCAARPEWSFDGPNPEAGLRSIPGVGTVLITDNGVWAACAECARMVEAGDVDGLARRADGERQTGRTEADLRSFFARALPGLSPKRGLNARELASRGELEIERQDVEGN